MKLSDHPQVTKVIRSFGSTWPEVVFQRTLFVETTIPFSEQQAGYDRAQFAWLIDATMEEMQEFDAEKAEIVSPDWTSSVEVKNPCPAIAPGPDASDP